LFLLLLACLLFFARLRAPLLEPQEARYAEIPRQMLAEGSYLVPVLHGQPYLDKPPLLYWLVMASYRLFGVADWSARLVPAGCGVLTVLLVYLWGRRTAGPRAGLCGAVLLCLTAEFIYRGRMLSMDALLCPCVVAALAGAHLAFSGPRLRLGWWVLSAGACGLGLLAKGPVILALVAPPVLALALLDPRIARPRARHVALYLAGVVAVAAPWYATVLWVMPQFAGYFFWKHNVVRFVTPFDHARPAWFYLPGLLLGLLPWTLLVPRFARYLARRGQGAGERPAALGFYLLCFAWGLLFFSAAGSKRATYLLPVLPPLALALGCFLDACLPRGWAALWRHRARLATAAAAVALLLGAGMAFTAAVLGVLRPDLGYLLAGIAVTTLAGLARRPRPLSWAAGAGIVFLVLWSAVFYLQPAYNRRFALRGQLRQASLAELRQQRVVCYPQRWDSVSFYLPKSQVHVYGSHQRQELIADLRAHPRTLVLVKSGPVLRQLLRELPPWLEFVSRARPGAVTVGEVRRRDRPAPVWWAGL
jgi:4-amino-4-deoxy-L-arabinose transferase-like glycosyltransferase